MMNLIPRARTKSVNKLIIAHLNINSLINKFEFLVDFIRVKIDSLMISETKMYESFPLGLRPFY